MPKNQKLEISINLKTICNKFIECGCDKQGYMQETRLRYIKDVNRLIKYMEENKIYKIEELDVDEFQNHIFTKKDTKGKTISRKTLNNNPFDKLSNYGVNKNVTDKRNFTLDELRKLFSGRHDNARKEILDCLKFLLLNLSTRI